jgi:hypothetical protein
MKIKLTAANPESHQYTMTATMSLAEWIEIRKEVSESSKSPIWEFKNEIDKAIRQAEKEYRIEE